VTVPNSSATIRLAAENGHKEPDTDSPAAIGSALERLLARFEALARRAARARGLDAAAVDEVLQDVRIRLWRSQSSSEKIEGLGASYLLRVVASTVIDHLRAQRRRREASLDMVVAAPVAPEALQVSMQDFSEQNALAERLGRALEQLSPNRRLAVRLHLEGYERHEIGDMTGWTEAKVRNLIYRGLDDLRALLKEHGDTTA